MHLLVDIGNSRLKWNLYDAGLNRFSNEMHSVGFGVANLQVALDEHWNNVGPVTSVVVANVAGAGAQQTMNQWVVNRWRISPRFVQTGSHEFGVKNGYSQANQLGVDRWVALLAANKLAENQPVCVVDCGTALTIDVLDEHGSHLGGLIIPGVELMKTSITERAHGIVNGDSASTLNLFARNTYDGVNNGIYYAAVSFIDGMVNRIESALKQEVHKVITGGDASKIIPYLSHRFKHVPDLVLQGLVLYLD